MDVTKHFVGTNFICHVVAHFSSFSSTYFLRGHNMLCLPKPLTTSYGINSFIVTWQQHLGILFMTITALFLILLLFDD